MTAPEITHFVFVDFENVGKIDLELIPGPHVQVNLLIGKSRKNLDLALVRQMRLLQSHQVQLIEPGVVGHNALDLMLASHLCRIAAVSLKGRFFIVAKDTGYDSLVAHLKEQGIDVSRHNSFAELSFLASPVKKSLSQPPFAVSSTSSIKPPAAQKKAPTPAKSKTPVDKYQKLLEQLKVGKNRPRNRARLMHHIFTCYGQKPSELEQAAVINRLIGDKIVTIDDKDKVAYL